MKNEYIWNYEWTGWSVWSYFWDNPPPFESNREWKRSTVNGFRMVLTVEEPPRSLLSLLSRRRVDHFPSIFTCYEKWTRASTVHYSFLKPEQSSTANVCCNKFDGARECCLTVAMPELPESWGERRGGARRKCSTFLRLTSGVVDGSCRQCIPFFWNLGEFAGVHSSPTTGRPDVASTSGMTRPIHPLQNSGCSDWKLHPALLCEC